jgi:peptidoglycan/LPS O-acetylase OafA/YrhL
MIFPIYYLVFAALLISGILLGQRVSDWPFFATYTQNWLYAGSATFDDDGRIQFPWGMSHTWSLAIEEQFYILWPLAVRNLSPRNLFRMALVLIALGPFSRCVAISFTGRWWTAYTPLFAQIDMLAWGALGAIVYAEKLVPRWRAEFYAKWAFAAGSITLAFGAWRSAATLAHPGALLSSLEGQIIFASLGPLYLSFLILAMRGDRLTRSLELRPIRYCGRISYGLYLYHWPILVFIESMIGVQFGIWTAIAVASTFVVSAASYRWIERPILSAKDRIFPRQAPNSATTACRVVATEP